MQSSLCVVDYIMLNLSEKNDKIIVFLGLEF